MFIFQIFIQNKICQLLTSPKNRTVSVSRKFNRLSTSSSLEAFVGLSMQTLQRPR